MYDDVRSHMLCMCLPRAPGLSLIPVLGESPNNCILVMQVFTLLDKKMSPLRQPVLFPEPAGAPGVPARTVRIQEPSKEELGRSAGKLETKPAAAGDQSGDFRQDAAAGDDTTSAPKKGALKTRVLTQTQC